MGNVKKGGMCFRTTLCLRGALLPGIALMNNNREAERALRGGLQWSTQPCIEFGIRRQELPRWQNVLNAVLCRGHVYEHVVRARTHMPDRATAGERPLGIPPQIRGGPT